MTYPFKILSLRGVIKSCRHKGIEYGDTVPLANERDQPNPAERLCYRLLTLTS